MHKVLLDGLLCRIRSATVDDVPVIAEIRLEDEERNKYINSIQPPISEFAAWLLQNAVRGDNDYFVIENRINGRPESLTSLFDIDSGTGTFGRTVVRQGSMATAETYWLCLRVAFEIFNLNRVVAYVNENNSAALSVTKAIGFTEFCQRTAPYTLDGSEQTETGFELTLSTFDKRGRPYLEKSAKASHKMFLRRNKKEITEC
jgi:RimJ/RimL family protein N-acetyltransferase